ncbi:amidohydrolase [Sphingobium jiangsuense]|uniref:2,3-dihydroxybenzoate decarboxylase n=1 Tax=Sphingobium jiangsuense TaxID=870476 RepID=A0A7W6BQL8_9SPHN|nr:amidohydrolase family protein [Sphingobium jiangsuense]MBB3928240.1 2,3-dihydroxybenzoate decarboxylase [Sphingobium jiangsuense]GLS99384.1 amidohydrolase [Sphingobium jiangsuense]
MQGKIALEEHFALPETLEDSRGFFPDTIWDELRARLLDIQDRRLREMDENGIELMILSLNAPTIQAIADPAAARELARRANDYLAEEVAKRPDRFRGFAALPLQDPAFAAEEMERCVRDLGFVGALVNGFSQVGDEATVTYYDGAEYRPFWRTVEALGVPFYLHPRNPLLPHARIFQGHEWLMGPTWAFGQETAVHALRLIGSGLFDDCPKLQFILGHMGEGLPFSMWRIDNRNRWMDLPPTYRARRLIGDYFRENFHLTTSGNFRTPALADAIAEIGVDRIMFSTDWPFENVDHAANWFDAAEISDADRRKIGRDNARALFGIE